MKKPVNQSHSTIYITNIAASGPNSIFLRRVMAIVDIYHHISSSSSYSLLIAEFDLKISIYWEFHNVSKHLPLPYVGKNYLWNRPVYNQWITLQWCFSSVKMWIQYRRCFQDPCITSKKFRYLKWHWHMLFYTITGNMIIPFSNVNFRLSRMCKNIMNYGSVWSPGVLLRCWKSVGGKA